MSGVPRIGDLGQENARRVAAEGGKSDEGILEAYSQQGEIYFKLQGNFRRGLFPNYDNERLGIGARPSSIQPPASSIQHPASSICASAFAYADVEGKKFLTKHQYKIAMTAMFGFCPDKWDIKQMLADTSNNGNLITFQKFQNSVRRKIDSPENFLNFDYFFTCLDRNSKGYLIFDDLLTAAEEVNLKIPPVILKGAFKELDHDRKGFIRMDDFVAMMRCR
ncbi:uncharacterized protein LOC124178328 [Neodiprion fabricii]|uniref:uncharacterized protein LOC124178328 n=1 Tax=Neodiprion fabricii TaxID=2872261 RepID=UPI001ED8E18C|nr:uncharacterized protein LOC124178328 [Neodiprion fabricii]